mgnify:CR=1 FL=1
MNKELNHGGAGEYDGSGVSEQELHNTSDKSMSEIRSKKEEDEK